MNDYTAVLTRLRPAWCPDGIIWGGPNWMRLLQLWRLCDRLPRPSTPSMAGRRAETTLPDNGSTPCARPVVTSVMARSRTGGRLQRSAGLAEPP